MPITTYQIVAANNLPNGSSFMDATAGATYLVNVLQDLKATIRQQELATPWVSLLGLTGAWVGGLAWTLISGTQASMQGDQSVATGTGYLAVGQRVRAFVQGPPSIIYGQVTAVSVSGGITTVTFAWDSGILDSGLTDIQTTGDVNATLPMLTQMNVVTISNGGSGSAFTGTLAPAIRAYVTGQQYRFKWTQDSQGADTVALNGLAAVPLHKLGSNALTSPGDFRAGSISEATYDGAAFQVGPVTEGLFDLKVGNPATDILNTTTETTIYTRSIPGGALGPNGALRIILLGQFFNQSGAINWLDVRVKFGGLTVLDSLNSLTSNSSANACAVRGDIILTNLGSTTPQFIDGRIEIGVPEASPTMNTGNFSIGQTVITGVDSSIAQTLTITVQLSSATNCEYQSMAVYVEHI